jgi:hypothetical protein
VRVNFCPNTASGSTAESTCDSTRKEAKKCSFWLPKDLKLQRKKRRFEYKAAHAEGEDLLPKYAEIVQKSVEMKGIMKFLRLSR